MFIKIQLWNLNVQFMREYDIINYYPHSTTNKIIVHADIFTDSAIEWYAEKKKKQVSFNQKTLKRANLLAVDIPM